MSSNPIVPQRVLDTYLARYNAAQRLEINATYLEIRDRLMAEHGGKEDRSLLITAGAPGAGKTTHLRKKAETAKANGRGYIRIDIDDIMGEFPTVKGELSHLAAYFETACDLHGGHTSADTTHRTALRETSITWTMAAKYVADRLLNDCVSHGLPVAFETSAHNFHIGEFLANVRDNAYNIELDLCDAPTAIKQQETQKRFDRGEAYVNPEFVTLKGNDVMHNIDTYLRYADIFNIYWRSKSSTALIHAATSAPKGAQSIVNQDAAEAFDANSKDTGVSIEKICATHKALASQSGSRAIVSRPSPRLAL